MDEKTMVNDILNSCKLSLDIYQTAISEMKNMALRQVVQQIRNNEESFQYEIVKIAEVKGYYTSAEEATPEEIKKIKKELE